MMNACISSATKVLKTPEDMLYVEKKNTVFWHYYLFHLLLLLFAEDGTAEHQAMANGEKNSISTTGIA